MAVIGQDWLRTQLKVKAFFHLCELGKMQLEKWLQLSDEHILAAHTKRLSHTH